VCYIDEVDEVSDGERERRAQERALAKKRKDKQRKERKAARQVLFPYACVWWGWGWG